MKVIKLTCLLLFFSVTSYAQVVSSGGGTGDWNDPDSWSPSGVPTASSGTITIQNGHTITVSDVQSADELNVQGDGTLIIANGGQLSIVDGSGDDLTVEAADFITTFSDGILTVQSGGELVNSGQVSTPELTFTVQDGAKFTHNQNGGVIPIVTWDNGSTLEIQGVTSSIPTGIDQAFYNFIYNSGAQTSGILYLNGLTTINGDLDISNTNTRFLAVSSSDNTLSVGGNVTVSNSSKFYLSPAANVTLNVGGDLTVDSNQSSFALLFTAAATGTINVSGDFVKSNSGTINFSASGGSGILNVDGDFTVNSGTLTESGSSSGTINFTGNTLQTYVNSGTISNSINFNVASDASVDFGTSIVSGLGTFTTNNLSEIRVGSTAANGPVQTTGAGGNIRVTGGQTYDEGTTIVFNGDGPQFIGSLFPDDVNTVIDNNDNGATLVSDVTFNGDLTLTSGDLSVDGHQLTLSANLNATSNIAVTTASDIVINGTGTIGTFPFASSTSIVHDFTIDRSGATVVFGDDVTINGALALTDGDLDFSGHTLNLEGTFTSGTGVFLADNTSTLNITGTGAFGAFEFDPGANNLGALTFNRTSGTATLQGTLNIASALTLSNGAFTNGANLFMNNGSLLTKNSAATFSSNHPETDPGETYNVTYTGSNQTTGLEIPDEATTDALGNLTLNAGTVTLNQSLQVNGNVTLQNGSLSIGSNQLTVGGDWVRNGGSLDAYTGQVIFNGTTTFPGSTVPTFVNMQVSASSSITLPATTININGNLQVDPTATFDANGGTVRLGTTSGQNIVAGGAIFNNININKSSGTVTIASPLNLAGRMDFLGSSTSTVASGGNLVVMSTSDGSSENGSIGVVPSGANISGNVTVQRYMSGEGRIYRYLSSPVTNANFEQWRDDFPITGTFDDPSTGTGIVPNSPSLYRYVEASPGLADDGWEPYPTSGALASSNIEVGRGYAAFIREGSDSTIIDVVGPINLANVLDIDLNVTYNDDGNGVDNEGWNLVGNPFPSTIYWNNVLSGSGGTKVNVDDGIQVRDNGGGGVYRTWDGSVGDLNNGYIASGQAFWVQTIGTSPVLTLNEQAKSSSTTGSFYRIQQEELQVLQIALSDGTVTDNAFISLKDGTTSGYNQGDTPNLNNSNINGETMDVTTFGSDSVKLAINYVGSFGCSGVVPIDISDVTTGTYTLSFSKLETITGGYDIILKDAYLDSEQSLSTNAEYIFDVDNTDPNSFGSGRFSVEFSKDVINGDLIVNATEAICDEDVANVTLAGSQDGVSYHLLVNEEPFGEPSMGTGGDLQFEIPAEELTTGNNNIEVVADYEGCSSKTIGDVIAVEKTVINNELTFDLNNNICSGENAVITLNNSENGVGYQLLLNGEVYGSETVGTGNDLAFEITNESLNETDNTIMFSASSGSCTTDLLQVESVSKVSIDPSITIGEEGQLVSNYETGNQWYLDGELIEGATDNTFTPIVSGTYTLEVSKMGCSASSSVEYSVEDVTGMADEFANSITVYPNPVKDKLNIEAKVGQIKLIEIFDSRGYKFFSKEVNTKKFEFNSRYLSNGIYFLRLTSQQNVTLQRFIKE